VICFPCSQGNFLHLCKIPVCTALRKVEFTSGVRRLATLRRVSMATRLPQAVEARVPAGLAMAHDTFLGCLALTPVGVRGYGWARLRSLIFLRGVALYWQGARPMPRVGGDPQIANMKEIPLPSSS